MSETVKNTVLFVDDEEYVLKSLRRVCRKEDFRVLTASNGPEALELLGREPVDIVVSDLRMPQMDGTELLRQVQENYPGIYCILFSGNADLPSVIKAVNEGSLAYYFQKPWDDDSLKLTLRGFLERKQLREMEQALSRQVQEQNETLLVLNEQLEAQAKTIAQEAETKSRFFSTMSHEIRTPLNGLLGVLQLLNDDKTLKGNELLATSLATAQDLKRIADDVLDLSQLESGKFLLDAVVFSPVELGNAVVQLMHPNAEEKGLLLRLSASCSPTLRLTGDPARLRQILANLVSNAIKFTDAGEVQISIDYQDSLKIEVSDTGIGISEERRERLFSAFETMEPAHASHYGGTGLGLSITSQLVEQMGGSIGVESVPGEGATFTVSLPLATASEDPNNQEPSGQGNLDGRRYLIVDDNETNCMVISAAIVQRGAIADTDTSGLAAIRRMKEGGPGYDAVLLDINMPELDGFETLEILRTDAAVDCPVYALTAQLDEESLRRYEEAGFHDVIGKPVDFDEMSVMLLGETATSEAVERPASVFEESVFDQLIQNTGPEVMQKLVDSYCRDATARGGRVREALSTQNWQVIGQEAHALNNSAAMFGAMSLHGLCKTIDQKVKQEEFADLEQEAQVLADMVDESIEQVKRWASART